MFNAEKPPSHDDDLRKEIERLRAALENIRVFGFVNPGYGHSCARKAAVALGLLKEKV